MKCCAVAYFALSPHPAAMTNNDPLHRRQSNSCSSKFYLTVETLERLE